MAYRDYIAEMKEKWIGKMVIFAGEKYKVMDVDYNGALLINKQADFTTLTAVGEWMVKEVK